MLNDQKIIFVSIVDSQSMSIPDLGIRIWHHENLVKSFLETKTCLIGRKTYELTRWKGENVFVLTHDKNWTRYKIKTIHDLNDLYYSEGDIYVLGGNSVFKQLEKHVDEIHLYVVNGNDGKEPWIDTEMGEWDVVSYVNSSLWSYAHLVKSDGKRKSLNLDMLKNFDPKNN